MTNTGSESVDLEKIVVQDATPLHRQVESLQKELATQKDSRSEERFAWLCAVIVLVDALILSAIGFWEFTPILFFEMVGLLILAKRWGIEEIDQAMDRASVIIRSWRRRLDDED